jgi:hypothetical protein
MVSSDKGHEGSKDGVFKNPLCSSLKICCHPCGPGRALARTDPCICADGPNVLADINCVCVDEKCIRKNGYLYPCERSSLSVHRLLKGQHPCPDVHVRPCDNPEGKWDSYWNNSQSSNKNGPLERGMA